MMRRYYYLLSLLFVFVIPSSIAGYFVWSRILLPQFATFVVSILALGSVWDMWATRHGRKDAVWIWTFNHKDTLGLHFFDIPIEEYLFYLASSTYIVLMWEGIKFALETHSVRMYVTLPFLALWSIAFIAFPYMIRERKDRLY